MSFTLRPYQRAAIDGLYQYWADKRGDNPLIVAPTGSGKSAMMAQIIKDAMSFPGTRVMVVTHVKELLEQNAQNLMTLYPEAEFAFYSASIGQKRLDKPITFAGIQSVWEKSYNMVPAPDLVLIDEAHMLPKKTTTRYGKFIEDLKVCNPHVKIVGLTATPYRLDSGYLHKGEGAIFDGIAFDIPVGKLMDEGYLSPVISKGGLKQIDLSNVGKRGGEFIDAELASAASDPELVRATVKEIATLGADRKCWLVFGSGIEHAKMLGAEMDGYNITWELVTGSDSKGERERKINALKSGRIRCLINVSVLTTGFDCPHVDLVALVRATASAGLYVQMVGRGTRLADGKTDCLILDYGQNVQRHGFIDAIIPPKQKSSSKGGDAPVKECPSCQTMVHTSIRVCPSCGEEFPPPEFNHGTKSYDGAMLSSQVQAEWTYVDEVLYDRHRKEGKPDSIKVTYYCGMETINEWLCPDHGGYAASRYIARMPALGASATNTDDALKECQSWKKPGRIKIKPKPGSRFFDIVQLDYLTPIGDANHDPELATAQAARRAEDERLDAILADLDDDIPF